MWALPLGEEQTSLGLGRAVGLGYPAAPVPLKLCPSSCLWTTAGEVLEVLGSAVSPCPGHSYLVPSMEPTAVPARAGFVFCSQWA